MSFLAPWMLVALPLASIPIIIHLINQRRYQTTQWAAMMFLLTANKMNRGFAKVRQWLILAFRTLVVAALILAVGRPLVSGAIGAFVGRGASTAIVLIDRSPSMQSQLGSSNTTKLQNGAQQISQTLQTMATERIVLIESNAVTAREIESADSLLQLPELTASDKTADLPSMLTEALGYIEKNEISRCDIWICSDLRKSDFATEDGRWDSIRKAYGEMGRRVRFRLVAMPETDPKNHRLRVTSSAVVNEGPDAFAEVSLTIRRDSNENNVDQAIPITFDVGGNRSSVEISLQGDLGKLTGHRIALPTGQTSGYGSVSIPADRNTHDNEFHFSFDQRPIQRCAIVTPDEEVARVLKLAAEISSSDQVSNTAEVIAPSEIGSIAWDELSLLLWNAPLPVAQSDRSGDAEAIESFVRRGGRVVFFPPDSLSDHQIFGCSYVAWEQPNEPISAKTWRTDSDVLANTRSGASLSLGRIKVRRFADLQGNFTRLAKLDNDRPLLARSPTPNGGVYFCTTTVRAADSSMARDGVMLYAVLQRLLADGSQSLGKMRQAIAGTVETIETANWKRLSGRDDALSIDHAFVAGVYQTDDHQRLVTINRSEQEDDSTIVSDEKLTSLFDGLTLDRINPVAGGSNSFVEEAWRAFLITMLVAMIGEAALCLPRDSSHRSPAVSGTDPSLTAGGVS